MTRALLLMFIAATIVCSLLKGEARAHPSWGIVVDRNNQIYFSDLETVWKIDAQGKLTIFRAGASGRHTHELAIDEDGNLYGPDYSYDPATQDYINAIWKMTPDGDFTYIIAPTKGQQRGASIYMDRDGNMYAVEQNNNLRRETLILKRAPSGNVTVLAGSSYGHADGKGSQAKFSSIGGMAFGPDGSLYVTDNYSVRKVTMDGTVTTLADGLDTRGRDPNRAAEDTGWGALMGLTVNAQGDVYVADIRHRHVLKVTRDGAVSLVASAEPPFSPTGVAFREGNLYILEFGQTSKGAPTPRVRKLYADGKLTVLAAIGESASAPQNPAVENRGRVAPPKQNLPYALIGAVAGAAVLVLTLTIWLVRRRVPAHQQHN